jgi:uncharacterized protein (DUF427 family)
MTHPERIEPGPGQESVWDYPRPPAIEAVPAPLRVELEGLVLAETTDGYRILETSHPPVYYFPPDDVRMDHVEPHEGTSFCEFKGRAEYVDLVVDSRRIDRAGWRYPSPNSRYSRIAEYIAFYAHKVDACFVGDEQVEPQPGNFYGGWITSRVVGPFKGSAGTLHW